MTLPDNLDEPMTFAPSTDPADPASDPVPEPLSSRVNRYVVRPPKSRAEHDALRAVERANPPGRQYFKLPDRELTASVLEAFLRANGMEVAAWVEEDSADSVIASLKSEISRGSASVELLQQTHDDMDERIWGSNGSGALTMSREQQQKAIDRLDEVAKRLKNAQDDLRVLEIRLASEVLDAYVSDRELDAVIDGLRDPRSSRFRDVLIRGVRTLEFTSERIVQRGLIGTRLSWTGAFVFESPLGVHQIPFGGAVLLGAAVSLPPRKLRILRAMRHQGTPVWTPDYWPSNERGLVADLLGVNTRHFAVGACPDPDLVRLWMAIAYPAPAEGEKAHEVPTVTDLLADPRLHERFGDLQALIAHMMAMHKSGMQRWRFRRSQIETEEIIAAVGRRQQHAGATPDSKRTSGDAAQGLPDTQQRYRTRKLSAAVRGTTRAQRWSPLRERHWSDFKPCAWCSYPWAAVAQFNEAQGYICLGCRRDDAGIIWDHEFDEWIAHCDVWTLSGIDITQR